MLATMEGYHLGMESGVFVCHLVHRRSNMTGVNYVAPEYSNYFHCDKCVWWMNVMHLLRRC
jgi:hypothetical protein